MTAEEAKRQDRNQALATGIVLAVPRTIWKGFALSLLWGWFFVPVGAPPIGIAHAIGISLVIGWLVTQAKDIREARTNTMTLKGEIDDAIGSFALTALVLSVGWIAKWCM